MLEESMSVWPHTLPASPSLSGREGALVSVSIDVDPRRLESLLEALAQTSFPINPQIYHDAAVVYLDADGREETQTATLVEFPAYEGRLDEVRNALDSHGFEPASVLATSMLDEIHREPQVARRRLRQPMTTIQ
jgi:hypothetical protein